MAGIGPPPKDSRRRRNVPTRGDWVDLPALDKPVLGELPPGEWSDTTIATWESWRQDPATAQWTSADHSRALRAIRLVEKGTITALVEARQLEDTIGLSQAGKRSLRWRVGGSATAKDKQPAQVRRLRAVDPKAS